MTTFQTGNEVGWNGWPDSRSRSEMLRYRNFKFPIRSVRYRFRFAGLGLATDYKVSDGLCEPFAFVFIQLLNFYDKWRLEI